MITFIPNYSKKTLISFICLILVSLLFIYFFIDSDYKELELLGLPLIMLVLFIIYSRNFVIKSIVFEDVILIKRYVWKDITIGYEEIEHITFANLKAGRKNIVLQEILNLNELLHIFEEKIAEGKITIDNTKNQQIANKQYIRMSVGAMLFLL